MNRCYAVAVLASARIVLACSALAFLAACTPLKANDVPARDSDGGLDGGDAALTCAAGDGATDGLTYPNARIVTGDFDGDGKSDIALVGGAGWNSVPVALARPGMTFEVHNNGVAGFAALARDHTYRPVVGDFDGDGKSDIALVGRTGITLPIAFSQGAGDFQYVHLSSGGLAAAAAEAGTSVVATKIDGDVRDDLVVFGSADKAVTFALSNGDGSFGSLTRVPAGDFGASALQTTHSAVVGPCSKSAPSLACSLLLFGGTYTANGAVKPWDSVMIGAVPQVGDATMKLRNDSSPGPSALAAWTERSPIDSAAGDFDGDGLGDVAVFRAATRTVAIAYSGPPAAVGDPLPTITRTSEKPADPLFSLSCADGALHVSGDFDGDGKTDIAFLGAIGATSVTIAQAVGDGSFQVTPVELPQFAIFAAGSTGAR